MARLKRLYMPGCSQHIIQRGNNKNACFYSDSDYKFYLHLLEGASRKYEVLIHAFVLMTNHVHLLVTPTSEFSVSRMMQSIGRSYVQYINHTYDRTGTLWEGRYKSTLVDSDHYFLIVSRYIELNPVRAKMADHPAEYPWSSYQGNGLGKEVKLLTPHYLYKDLGETKSERAKNYNGLFEDHVPERTLEELREAINKGWVVGSNKFIKEVRSACGRAAQKRNRGGDRRSKFWDQ